MSNKVLLAVDGLEFVFWQDLQLTRAMDTVDAISFRAPFDYEAPGFRSVFKPFSYKPMQIFVDDDLLFSGTMVDVTPELDADSKTVQITGYATCGVLMDCTAPASALPLEFNNLNLRDIAERLCALFDIDVDFRGEPGAVFKRVACEPDKKIFDFLTDLAKQRGFIMASNETGDLLFWQSDTNTVPVATLREGQQPAFKITPEFKPQEYYSELTGIEPVEIGKSGSKTTAKPKAKKAASGGSKTMSDTTDPKGNVMSDTTDPNAKPASKAATKKKKSKAKAKTKPAKKYSKFTVQNPEADEEFFRPLCFKIDDVDGADVKTATKAKLARMLGNMASYSVSVPTWRDQNGNLWVPNARVKVYAPNAMIYSDFIFEIRSVNFEKSGDSETATLTLSLPGAFSGEPPETYPWE